MVCKKTVKNSSVRELSWPRSSRAGYGENWWWGLALISLKALVKEPSTNSHKTTRNAANKRYLLFRLKYYTSLETTAYDIYNVGKMFEEILISSVSYVDLMITEGWFITFSSFLKNCLSSKVVFSQTCKDSWFWLNNWEIVDRLKYVQWVWY